MLVTCMSSMVVLIFIVLCSKLVNRNTNCAITAITLSSVYLFLSVGVIGAIISFLHQSVSLKSFSISLAAVDIVLFIVAIKKHVWKQKFTSTKEMWIGIICVVVYIVAIAIWHFGPKLKLIYIDIDSSRYFMQAMDIRRTGKIGGEFLSPLILSLCIQWISPFVRAVSLYKGMILAHIGVQIISTCMFYILVNKVNKGTYSKAINILLTILYVSGFQLYVLVYGTFFHWQDGTLIIMFLIYHVLELQNDGKDMIIETISVLLGGFGLIVCYPFYMIIAFVLFLPEAIRWLYKHYAHMKIKAKILIFLMGICAIAAGATFALQRIKNVQEFLMNLQSEGVSYKEPFLDYIYFLPFLIVYIVLRWKKKVRDDCSVAPRMCFAGLIFICVWFILYAKGYLSAYYYYRNYYILWLLMWLMVAHVIRMLVQEKQTLFLGAYAAMYMIAVITSIAGVNKILTNMDEGMFLSDKSTQSMCPLYAFNMEQLVNKPAPAVSDEMFEGYNYVVNEFSNEDVIMLTSYYSFMQAHWYISVTDVTNCNQFANVRYTSVYEIFKFLDKIETKYLLVQKSDATWSKYMQDVLSGAEVLYENPECLVLKVPENGGCQSLIASYINSDNQKTQLFSYVAQYLAPKHFRVLCDWDEPGFEPNASTIFAKEDANDCVGVINTYNLYDYLADFEKQQVECIAVFKDSEIYQKNKEYFDSLINVYENDEGFLLAPQCGGWIQP